MSLCVWIVVVVVCSTLVACLSQHYIPTVQFELDTRGYIIYCPCLGRFGNQAEHFLGALGFAKSVDRTLVIPPWRTYKNIAFDEWFKVQPLLMYHRVILAEDFMNELAPVHWPPSKRTGWCFSFSEDKSTCNMKQGSPFGPFWDELGVDFVDYVLYNISFEEYYINTWKTRFPASKYPVMAFKGAPASFPVKERHVSLHQYLQWSDKIEEQALHEIEKYFRSEPFIGLHLRNGLDWVQACGHVDGSTRHFMASPQCLGYGANTTVTYELCLPPTDEVLRLTTEIVVHTDVKYVYVATDKFSLSKELEEHLKPYKVSVIHLDPWLPQLDLAILAKSLHFIGNCVSSFSAFVARERLYKNLPTSYWSFSYNDLHGLTGSRLA